MIVSFFDYFIIVFISYRITMERKTEQFFDWHDVSMAKIVQMLQQYPAQAESMLDFVMKKLVHFTEFRVKKEHLEEKYEHKKQKLYAEYMKEE